MRSKVFQHRYANFSLSYRMDSDCLHVDQSASAPTDSLLFDPVPVNGALGVEVSSPAAGALPGSEAEDLDSYNPIEPPPLDWRSDSSSEVDSGDDLDDPSLSASTDCLDKASLGESVLMSLDKRDILTPLNVNQLDPVGNVTQPLHDFEVKLEDEAEAFKEEVRAESCKGVEEDQAVMPFQDVENKGGEEGAEAAERRSNDEDHRHIHTLLSQLQLMGEEPSPSHRTPSHHHYSRRSDLEACSPSLLMEDSTETTGLLFSESHQRDLLGMLQCTEIAATPRSTSLPNTGDVDAVVSVSYSQEDAQRFWERYGNGQRRQHRDDSLTSLPDDEYPEPVWMKLGEQPPEEEAAAESEQVGAVTKTNTKGGEV